MIPGFVILCILHGINRPGTDHQVYHKGDYRFMNAYRPTKKKKKGRASGLLVFLLVFVIFLAVFGGVCLWAVVNYSQQHQEEASSGESDASNTVVFSQSDIRNLFIVTIDGTVPRGFMLLRSDPQASRITAVAIPRETEVENGTSLQRLDQVYSEDGVQAAQAAAGKLLGVEWDHYLTITYDNIEKLLRYLDVNLQYTLEEDLDYREGDTFIKMSSGRFSLTAKQTVDILRYPSWQHGGLQQQADVQAELLAQLVNQCLIASRGDKAEEDFAKIMELSKSDIRVSHFTQARSGLEYLASQNSGGICTPVSLEGSYIGSGENQRFAADGAAEQLAKLWG